MMTNTNGQVSFIEQGEDTKNNPLHIVQDAINEARKNTTISEAKVNNK